MIVQDPEVHSGEPVFRGTRVPFQTLLDYLEGGETLDEFLKQFPGVTREQAVAALEEAKSLVLASFASEGDDVKRNHFFHLLDVGIKQRSDGSEAGIVNEHGDARIVLQLCLDFRQIQLVVDVRHDGSDKPSARAGEARRQLLEWLLAACHKNEIVSPFCETICIDTSDAPRGAGK